MKKLLFTIPIVLLAAYACGTQEEPMPDVLSRAGKDMEITYTTKRTSKEAIDIAIRAKEALNKDMGEDASFGIIPSKVVIVGNPMSRAAEGDTVMYIVNFAGNNGYALVSANRKAEGLLAVTERGCITDLQDLEEEENSALVDFMNRAICYSIGVPPIIPDPEDPFDPIPMPVVEYDTTYLHSGARIHVKWGQNWPLGFYCPNRISGCGATAGVQALSYFKKPTSVNYTFPNKDKNSETLAWDVIIQNVNSLPYLPSNYAQYGSEFYQIARLTRELGHRMGANYGQNSTSSTITNLRSTLNSLSGLSCTSVQNGIPDVPSTLNNGIIIMRGDTQDNEGHAFVIDGYTMITITKYTYEVNYNLTIIPSGEHPRTLIDRTSTVTKYCHINWGWDGQNNGYFSQGVYDTTQEHSYDNYVNNVSINFTHNYKYFTITQ